ncbi:MAG: autotransporter outer membrane beta-barrel domain-containing protein [Spirochaetia bacterium]|nr:autotransporter outer membrane beta-barrel domain-containing protein [Spirochaetia bacterium]
MICIAMIMIIGPVSETQGDTTLDGTPESTSVGTVYTATVKPGETYNQVYGVHSGNTDSKCYGVVNIDQGTVTGTVYGNRAISVNELTKAACNRVNIVDSTVGTVCGGYAYGGSDQASVSQNIVNITGGSVTMYVYGGNADGSTLSVTGNEVTLDHVTVGKTVYGSCAFNTASWLDMRRNTVTINGGSVNGSVYGGYASGSAAVSNNNTVIIEGGAHIKGSVYGGYALSSNSDAKYNTVFIKDSTVNNHIYGGIGRNAVGNTVVLYGGGDLTQADLYGYSDGRKSHSANTLEVWGSNISIRSAQNFENYYFIVPDGMVNQSDKYMLKSATPVNLSGTNVGIAMQNGTALNIGDTINLIDKTEATPAWVSLVGRELKGGTLFTNYDFQLSTTGDSHTLVATVASEPYREGGIISGQKPAGQAIPETKALAEGQAASVALLGEGSELAAGQALADAKTAAGMAAAEGENLAAFATFGGGGSRYDTGSHVDMRSAGFLAGLAKEFSGHKGDLLMGMFFETGHGDYSTHNHFEDGLIDGDGDAHYYGGGLMFQWNSSGEKGLYMQAMGRMGGMSNDWSSDDFSEKVDYDTYHCYWGTSVSVGYQGNVGKYIGYDVNGRFMWNHLEGDDADVKGEQLHFQDIDSVRTRIGLRMSYEGFRIVRPFIGGAWEREFDGEANAKVNGCKIDAPDLKGNTGLLELGVSCKPGNNADWRLDLSAAGYMGVRRGLSGSAYFTCNF